MLEQKIDLTLRYLHNKNALIIQGHPQMRNKSEPIDDKSSELFETKKIPSEVWRLIAYNQSTKDLSHMHRTSTFFKESLQPDLDTRQFLEAVAHGNQDEAERLLKKNLRLMIVKYSVQDYSKRDFPLISGFQYALAALDTRYMTGMMLNCIRDDETLTIEEKKKLVQELLKQYNEVVEEGVTYILDGITYHNQTEFGFAPLITALEAYVDNFGQLSWPERDKHFCTQVGSAQILVPAHLAQHYCEPGVPFDPKPTFTAKTFKRCLEVQNYVGDTVHGWWGAVVNFILGRDFGYVRLDAATRSGVAAVRGSDAHAIDLAAVKTIFEIRTEDRLTIGLILKLLIQEFREALESQEQTSFQPK